MVKFTVEDEMYGLATLEADYFYAKKGSMVAGDGAVEFDYVVFDPSEGSNLDKLFRHVKRKFSGENLPIMKVSGTGSVLLAEKQRHVNIVTLAEGQTLYVESDNLLFFSRDCTYDVDLELTGVISQKGVFITKITGGSENSQVGVSGVGNLKLLETPCFVDPDAVVFWINSRPRVEMAGFKDLKTYVGLASGESYTFQFDKPGGYVCVQPYERPSGLDIGIDDSGGEGQAGNPLLNSIDSIKSLQKGENSFGSDLPLDKILNMLGGSK